MEETRCLWYSLRQRATCKPETNLQVPLSNLFFFPVRQVASTHQNPARFDIQATQESCFSPGASAPEVWSNMRCHELDTFLTKSRLETFETSEDLTATSEATEQCSAPALDHQSFLRHRLESQRKSVCSHRDRHIKQQKGFKQVSDQQLQR